MAVAIAYPPQVTEGVVTKYVWAGLLAYGSAFSRLPKDLHPQWLMREGLTDYSGVSAVDFHHLPF